MDWFLVILAVLGLIMGIAPELIADNVKECTEKTEKSEKEATSFRINLWLLIFGAVIWLSSSVVTFHMTDLLDKENKEIKSRIELLEKQISQTDTTTVNIQNL